VKRSLKLTLLSGVVGLAVYPGRADAWDSLCYQYQDPNAKVARLQFVPGSRGCEGVQSSRGRWRDPELFLDEHRGVLAAAAKKAGLPKAFFETQLLHVLTDTPSDTIDGTRKFDVRAPQTASGAVTRAFSLDELAQLPDMSYSVWDWARGNEVCPLGPIPGIIGDYDGPVKCHQLAKHMGGVNANHFPPQSDKWFSYYHRLAMTRAKQCTQTRIDVWNKPLPGTSAVFDDQRRRARDASFASYFQACEVEALTYEAVAQHFLQDSWSAGHMWQRWGSADLGKFPDVLAEDVVYNQGGLVPFVNPLDSIAVAAWNGTSARARQLFIGQLVAGFAGPIHGADVGEIEVRYSLFPGLSCVPNGLQDQMCFPAAQSAAVAQGVLLPGVVGDVHAHDLVPGNLQFAPYFQQQTHAFYSTNPIPGNLQLGHQSQRLMGCASGSVATVFKALQDPLGVRFEPALGAAENQNTLNSVAGGFSYEACSAPSVTNETLFAGIDPIPTKAKILQVLKGLSYDFPDSIENRINMDYDRVRVAVEILKKANATGVDAAALQVNQTYTDQACTWDGLIPTCSPRTFTINPSKLKMLEVNPNSSYSPNETAPANDEPFQNPTAFAPYIDPRAPATPYQGTLQEPVFPASPLDPEDNDRAIRLAFHMSRAPLLCNTMSDDDFAAMRSLVMSLPEDTPAEVTEKAAVCDACAEWTAPFLRFGQDVNKYDKTAEPLCYYTSTAQAGVPYQYEPGIGSGDVMALARRHCGCGGYVAVTNAGVQKLAFDVDALPGFNPISTVGNGPVAVGSLPRDAVSVSQGRILVSHATGQIAGVKGSVEVDLDGDPNNGQNRLIFPGISNLEGMTAATVAGKELVLAASDNGTLVSWDLTNDKLCRTVNVAHIAGEGAYDVVVSPDSTLAWVSLRKATFPVDGELAYVDLPALARCDNNVAVNVGWIDTNGSGAGLGPMALSPDGTMLAVGGRFSGTCLDQVRNEWSDQIDVQVGCDRIFVLDVPSRTWKQFGNFASLPTRPGRFPKSVAWLRDSKRLAYATFAGVELGVNDSGWPIAFAASLSTPLPSGGTLRLADTSAPVYDGGGVGGPRHWTYNMPLDNNVIGEAVAVAGSAAADWVIVATGSGSISSYKVTKLAAGQHDPMWELSESDPETTLHISTSGSWYGGCRHTCFLAGGWCPDVCYNNVLPTAGFSKVNLGSQVRVFVAY